MTTETLMERLAALPPEPTFDHPSGTDRIEAYRKQADARWAAFEAIDIEAEADGSLIGRMVTFGVADGVAVYFVAEESGKFVRLQWVHWCDGYSNATIEAQDGWTVRSLAEEDARRNTARRMRRRTHESKEGEDHA